MNTKQTPLSPECLRHMHAYWRAANHLAIGQIYLYDNSLLAGDSVARGETP